MAITEARKPQKNIETYSPSSAFFYRVLLPARSSRLQSSSLGTMPFNANRTNKRTPKALNRGSDANDLGPFMICGGLRILSSQVM